MDPIFNHIYMGDILALLAPSQLLAPYHLPVAAAASVPFSLTSINALWMIFDTSKFSGDFSIFPNSASLENIRSMPSCKNFDT